MGERKMKIGLVTNSLRGGGAERMTARLAHAFCGMGYDVVVYLFDKTNMKYELPHQIEIYGRQTRNGEKYLNKEIKRVLSLRNVIKKEKVDVLLAVRSGVAPIAVLAAKNTKCKVIGAERANPCVYSRMYKWMFKMSARMCDGYVFQTVGAASCYPGSVQRKAVVIGNIAPVFERKENIGNVSLGICSAGRLVAGKDFRTLILAFHKVWCAMKGVTLNIYGEGEQEEELKCLVKKLGITTAVFFEGFKENLMEEMQKYSVFAFASRSEGIPNVLIEAMSVGMACVSTDCNFGPSELIRDGENGFLVPVGDVDELAEKMMALLKDSELRIRMGERAREIQNRYSEDRIANEYLQYMRSVCGYG